MTAVSMKEKLGLYPVQNIIASTPDIRNNRCQVFIIRYILKEYTDTHKKPLTTTNIHTYTCSNRLIIILYIIINNQGGISKFYSSL